MLSKLLKYEIKDSYKIYLLFNVALVFCSIMARFVRSVSGEAYLCFAIALPFIMFIAIPGMFLGQISKFGQSMFTVKGYLFNTLPVLKRDLLNSKLINSLIWIMLTFFCIGLSFYILFYKIDNTLEFNLISLNSKKSNEFFALQPFVYHVVSQFIAHGIYSLWTLITVFFLYSFSNSSFAGKKVGYIGAIVTFFVIVPIQVFIGHLISNAIPLKLFVTGTLAFFDPMVMEIAKQKEASFVLINSLNITLMLVFVFFTCITYLVTLNFLNKKLEI